MIPKNFRSYQLAKEFYFKCEKIRCAPHLQQQLLRAAASVVLNLAEGTGKPGFRDRMRFYAIAFGSLRECQAALELLPSVPAETLALADGLGGSLYKLSRAQPNG